MSRSSEAMPRSSEAMPRSSTALPRSSTALPRTDVVEVETPLGPARLHRRQPSGRAAGVVALGHGAGGGVEAADLVAVAGAAQQAGWQAVLVEQPWRVAGKRVAPAPARLDLAWLAAIDALLTIGGTRAAGSPAGVLPLVLGGRSAGARVACRTAARLGAVAVCCLAFPLHPPGRPERSRAEELALAGVPVLAVQGRRDPFGTPSELEALGLDGLEVVAVDGDHGLSASAPLVAGTVGRWLGGLGGSAG